MKKGFTLLELIVVIIIIGVLATLGITQYGKMIERARGAEAKSILGAIRQNAAGIFMANGNNCNAPTQLCNNTNVIGGDYDTGACANPGRTFFNYTITSSGIDAITVRATRCAVNTGKAPQLTVAPSAYGWVQLATNFTSGADAFTTSGEY